MRTICDTTCDGYYLTSTTTQLPHYIDYRGIIDTMFNNKDYINEYYDYGTRTATEIVKVIINNNATIVFWKDKTKTVVKRMPEDNNDIYSAVAQALAKKFFGSTTHFHKIVDKALVDKRDSRIIDDLSAYQIQARMDKRLRKLGKRAVKQGRVKKNGK